MKDMNKKSAISSLGVPKLIVQAQIYQQGQIAEGLTEELGSIILI